MAYGTVEMVTVDAYKGLRTGGIALAVIATVGMAVILTLNTAGAAHIPTGWTALAATGMMISPVLFLGGKILCKLDDLLERESGVRALTAQRRVARSPELGIAHRAEGQRHRADGTPWVPTDEAWLGDVAEAFELGRQAGDEPA
jgi:hypothetical protein